MFGQEQEGINHEESLSLLASITGSTPIPLGQYIEIGNTNVLFPITQFPDILLPLFSGFPGSHDVDHARLKYKHYDKKLKQ